MQVSLQDFLRKAPRHIRDLYWARKGLGHRRVRNMFSRLRGEEPRPGSYAGVKRFARYHRRTA
jgi:hypothetical protein